MIVGSDLPPEIYEIVQEAGRDNVFWWSNRWRQGRKPDVGNAASEMTNTVPGGKAHPTPSSTSESPISDNRGYDFQGDDSFEDVEFTVDFSSAFGVTFWAVTQGNVYNGSSPSFLSAFNVASDIPRTILRMRDIGGTIKWEAEAADDGFANFSRAAVTPTDEPGLIVTRVSESGGTVTVEIWRESENDTLTNSESGQWSSSTSGAELTIGKKASGESNNYMDGIISEMGVARIAISDSAVDLLRQSAPLRHGISL